MSTPNLTVTADEYAARRSVVLDALEGAAGIVLAGSPASSASLEGRWRADPMFRYLSGLDHEGGAAILFDPSAEDPARRITLFLRPRDIEMERWEGARQPIDASLRGTTGFSTIKRTPYLPGLLSDAARRTKRLACLHPFTSYTADVSADLDIFHKIAQRVPGVAIEDRTQLLPSMRAIKSPTELALIERAVVATAAGFAACLRSIRPGIREKDIAGLLLATYDAHDSEAAYELIIGAGLNSTVLHYSDNNATCAEGDLVVMDCAASYGGYASDVTRTIPISGVFSTEQREIYEVVLEAELAGIAAARPGATYTEVDAAARGIIEKAGYGDAFIHGTSHPVGIEVHDICPDGPLKPGMVITVEPGIYLPDRGFGVRIEDDILITENGNRDLTSAIPKTIEAIEEAMGR
jgi:Xaa-Pro aminopeptidase